MSAFRYLVCGTSLLLVATTTEAACTGSNLCANVPMNAYVSVTGSPSIESPVVIYKGTWAGAWGGAISFAAFNSQGTLPDSIDYPITFGTLDITGVNSIQINSSSANARMSGYYALTDSTGDMIPYTVSYTACNSSIANNTQYITPNPSTGSNPPVGYVLSQVNLAGLNPPCRTQLLVTQAGQGSGKLTFSLVRPMGVTQFASGTYQDTLHITICTSGICN